jgi:hypothetical protein
VLSQHARAICVTTRTIGQIGYSASNEQERATVPCGRTVASELRVLVTGPPQHGQGLLIRDGHLVPVKLGEGDSELLVVGLGFFLKDANRHGLS